MPERARQVRRLLRVPSRDSSAVRRAAIVAATVARSPEADAAARRRLVRYELAHARTPKDRKAARRLYDYRSTLSTDPARSHIVREVSTALWADGGRALRACAHAAPDLADAAAAAIDSYIVQRREHGVAAASATALLLRASLAGAVADALMGKVLAGKATDTEAKLVTSMGQAARIDALTSFQIQKQADESERERERMRRRSVLTEGHTDAGANGVVRPELVGLRPSQLVRCDRCDYVMPGTARACAKCGADIAPDPNAPASDAPAPDSPTNGKKENTST